MVLKRPVNAADRTTALPQIDETVSRGRNTDRLYASLHPHDIVGFRRASLPMGTAG